jgi:hypothetical protein
MKLRYIGLVWLLVALVFLLSGCIADEMVNYGDDILRLYGDDILKLSSQIMRNSGDETARALGTTGLAFKANTNLTSVQDDVLHYLSTELSSESEAALFLESACNIISYVSLVGEYPTQGYTKFYVTKLAEENGIKIISQAEFIQNVSVFAAKLIKGQEKVSVIDGAKLVKDGLCLIP